MTNRLTKLAKSKFIPGIAYKPAIPAHCYTTAYQTTIYAELGTVFRPTYKDGHLVLTAAQKAAFQTANFIQTANVNGSTSDSTSPLTGVGGGVIDFYQVLTFYYVYTALVNSTTCVPAVAEVPGRAAQYVVDTQKGWTSGARSNASLVGNATAEFVFAPVPSAVVCGLASGGGVVDIGAIEHGVYATAGQFRIIESGVVVATVYGPTPYDQPKIRIRRSGTAVTYAVGSWTYSSDKPSVGAKTLQATMYAAGDYVDSPSIYATSDLSGIGWVGLQVTGDSLLRGTGKIGLRAVDRGQTRVSLRFGFVSGGSNKPYGQGKVKLPRPYASGYGGFPTVQIGGGEQSIPFYVGGVGKSGGIGSGNIQLPGIQLRGSSGPYASGGVRLPAIQAQGISSPAGNEVTTATRVTLGDFYYFQPTVFIMVKEGLGIGGTLELVFVFQEDLAEFLGIGDTASATFLLDLLIHSNLNVRDDVSQVKQDLAQYATNVATGGVTRYSNFGFKSFVKVGMRSFGLRSDGLYELTGDTDDGAFISGIVDFVTEDFGTAMRKRVSNIYVGLATDGQVFVKLTDDDGRDITYRASKHGSTAKVTPAKGISSRFWNMRLEIVDATYAEVDNIEWYVGATGRRLGR